MNHYMIAGFLTFIVNSVLSIMIIKKNFSSKLNRVFVLFSIGLVLYGLGFAYQAIAPSPQHEMLAIRIILTGATAIPIFFLFTAYAIVNKEVPHILCISLYCAGMFFEILNWATELLAKDPIPRFSFQYLFQAASLYPLLAFFFTMIVLFVFWFLLKEYKVASTGFKRNQIRYFFIGSLFGFGGGTPGFILGYNIELYPLNPYGAYFVSMFLISAYVLIKYQLVGFMRGIRIVTAPFISLIIIIFGTVLFKNLWIKIQARFFKNDEIIVFSMLLIVIFITISKTLLFFLNKYFPQKNYRDLLDDYGRQLGECHKRDTIFLCMRETLQHKDGPRPVSGGMFFGEHFSAPYQIQMSFGDTVFAGMSFEQKSAFITFVNQQKNSVLRPVLFIRDELHKVYPEKEAALLQQELDRVHASVCVPCCVKQLDQGDLIAGFLCVGPPGVTDVYDEEDYAFFSQIASCTTQAILALESRKLAYLKEKEAYQQQLISLSRTLLGINEREKLAHTAAEIIANTLGVCFVTIFIHEEDQGVYRCMGYEGQAPSYVREQVYADTYFIRFLHEHKEPVYASQLVEWVTTVKSTQMQELYDQAQKLSAEVMVPLVMERLLGFIILGKRGSDMSYDASDWNTLVLVSNNISMALQNIHLNERAVRDSLTKLYNHGYFQEYFLKAIALSVRYRQALTLVMIDIDHFKHYNDLYGHSQGNSILKTLGAYLERQSRQSDLVARLGGEEFGWLMPNVTQEQAVDIVERFREGMKKERILNAITVSAGMSSLALPQGQEGLSAYHIAFTRNALYTAADTELYRAKNTGRNRICTGPLIFPIPLEERGKIRSAKILIIEDLEREREAFMHLLQLHSHDVFEAENGKKAVAVYQNEHPDIVLLDLGLPDMDGVEVLKHIREKDQKTLVWVITAHGERKKELLEFGANEFDVKPIRFESFLKRLEELIA